MPDTRSATLILVALALAACATSHVMIGQARPPISPEEVQVYTRPPTVPYEEIARLQTSSSGSFSFTAQGKTDAVIKRLKTEAAKLGANGVLLEGMSDRASGSIGIHGRPLMPSDFSGFGLQVEIAAIHSASWCGR